MDNGIAWMIAGGMRAESAEDQRQRLHRVAVNHDRMSRGGTLPQLRARVAAIVAPRPAGRADAGKMSADCCPA